MNEKQKINWYDIKLRFIAQYWGQNVGEYVGRNDATINMNTINQIKSLFLKPLSKITKDDLEFIYQNEKINTPIDGKDIFLTDKLANFAESDVYLTDYLRSQGYALPFMECSIDDMISFGWIKLI